MLTLAIPDGLAPSARRHSRVKLSNASGLSEGFGDSRPLGLEVPTEARMQELRGRRKQTMTKLADLQGVQGLDSEAGGAGSEDLGGFRSCCRWLEGLNGNLVVYLSMFKSTSVDVYIYNYIYI